jgi:4-hydroxyproline epimerase
VTRIHVIDSHTGGEPTRVIVSGGPDLGRGPIQERLERFRSRFDHIRSAVVNEPRGNDAIVGALLTEPHDPTCQAGVVFFNNVGFLNMCGHGTIGLMATLQYIGRIGSGVCRIDTNCGPVEARLNTNGSVTIRNVPSYRSAAAMPLDVPGIGRIHGDIAWGGNWFFLVADHGQELSLSRLEALTDYTWRVRQALGAAGITGADGREIDHIELFGPPADSRADSKNFVLCPGKAYDRSPCGTGTSAKLACLYADGKLKPGETWRQESIVGSVFEGGIALADGKLYPEITGYAYVNAESDLILDEADPFCFGIRASCAQAST